MKISRFLGAAALTAAAVAGSAVPAFASVPYFGAPQVQSAHRPFVVIVNGAADVTLQALTVGQVVYHAGVAYTVVNVHGHAVRFVPALTGPSGTVYQFST